NEISIVKVFFIATSSTFPSLVCNISKWCLLCYNQSKNGLLSIGERMVVMKMDKRNWLILFCCVVLLTACSKVSLSASDNSALTETTQALETPLPQRFRSMAAGSYGTCLIIAPDGSLVGWGANENGELPGVNSSLSFEERR